MVPKGPFYNGGTAWDGKCGTRRRQRSRISTFHDLPATTGGHAPTWVDEGLFVRRRGADQYAVNRGLGVEEPIRASRAFLDLER